MSVGTVIFFNLSKGYGFIEPKDGGNDVLVSLSTVEKSGFTDLKEGQKVSYVVVAGPNGKSSADSLSIIA